MFLKITHNDSDRETRIECRQYEYQTDSVNPDQVIFTLDVGNPQGRSYVFNKGHVVIYIESEVGKTIDKFAWIPERNDKREQIGYKRI